MDSLLESGLSLISSNNNQFMPTIIIKLYIIILINYYLEDIKDNPDSSKESIWYLDWEGQ